MLVSRLLIIVLAATGLVWGVTAIPLNPASDDLHVIEAALLRGEDFSPRFLNRHLAKDTASTINDCDVHALNALSIMDFRFAENSLRAGNTSDFTKHTQSARNRTEKLLSCAPHNAFGWALAFSLDVLLGQLDQHSYRLLAMSYRTSPNEAWISTRRNAVAMPFVTFAPDDVRRHILNEFQSLVSNGFTREAARIYVRAKPDTQQLLKQQVNSLSASRQREFFDRLDDLAS